MIEPESLLDAYRHGIFPMALDQQGDIGWFSPDPRAIIPLGDRFHVPHGLRRVLKKCRVEGEAPAEPKGVGSRGRDSPGGSSSKAKFLITFDTNFESVVRQCARRKEGTWISKEIIESYCELQRLGHAHSVEVRLMNRPEPKSEVHPMIRGEPQQAQHDKRDDHALSTLRSSRSTLSRSTSRSSLNLDASSLPLVGGLYGVHIGGAFFGESMFHRTTDASKVALVALVERLRTRGFVLLDTQWQTPHLAQFGTHEISRGDYLRRLEGALKLDCKF